MPEATLKAFGDHGELGQAMSTEDDGTEKVIRQFSEAGINVDDLGAELQSEGAKSFVKSWNELMDVIASKGVALQKAG
jgi:transaldolase